MVVGTIFGIASGIVGAGVTLMGVLALPPMLRAGYSVSLAAGTITSSGTLGILIPPSVMLIVYGATAGVSVVKLYAGAFGPGFLLAGLFLLYIVVACLIKPSLGPPRPKPSATCRCPPLPRK
jgi:TRAP-type mannitol/chloroaromatic compound transport system permease large subunit